MRQAKRDTLWKEIETEGKWQKKKKHETNRFYSEKRNDCKKGKTRRYTKGKKEKNRRKIKDPTKK